MAVETSLGGDMDIRYTNRSLRCRRNTSQRECSLSGDSQQIRDIIYTM